MKMSPLARLNLPQRRNDIHYRPRILNKRPVAYSDMTSPASAETKDFKLRSRPTQVDLVALLLSRLHHPLDLVTSSVVFS